jgi:hypothetical protein
LFLSLALAVLLAVDGWLAALGVWSNKGGKRDDTLVHLFLAGVFTVMAACVWYVLAFRGRPLW